MPKKSLGYLPFLWYIADNVLIWSRMSVFIHGLSCGLIVTVRLAYFCYTVSSVIQLCQCYVVYIFVNVIITIPIHALCVVISSFIFGTFITICVPIFEPRHEVSCLWNKQNNMDNGHKKDLARQNCALYLFLKLINGL